MPLLVLNKFGASCLDLMAILCGVIDFDWTAAADLEAIVEKGSRSEAIDAKARAGIVDLEQLDFCAGVILDGCVDVVRVAGGEKDELNKSE